MDTSTFLSTLAGTAIPALVASLSVLYIMEKLRKIINSYADPTHDGIVPSKAQLMLPVDGYRRN